jgi:hypothetical protein
MSEYFYNAHIRSIIAVFGTLFNDVKIARRETDGSLTNQRTVPIAYGPRQKFLTRIDERPELGTENVAIKLPRISFEMKNLTYDPTRQKQRNQYTYEGANKVWEPVPYKISMDLSIMSKNQDEGLQIIEQILPMFSPSLGFRLKPISAIDSIVDDVKITLTNGVSIDDQYTGDFTTRRVLIYTLSFEIFFNLYRVTSTTTGVIKTVTINYRDFTTEVLFEGTRLEVNPPDAIVTDDWTVDITTIPGFDDV